MSSEPSLAQARILFRPERLTQARLSRRLTKADLASLVGVTPAAVGQYERGVVRPTAETLGRLAIGLQYPVRFFASAPADLDLGEQSVHFRRLRATSSSARALQVARLALVEELVARLEVDVELPVVDVPSFPLQTGEREEIEAVAAAVRRHWGLGNGPIMNIVALLESNGAVVVRADVDTEGVDAYSRWSGPRPVIVLTRDKDDAARSNFDAGHELGHLVMHHDPMPGSRIAESEAQMFASAFLMPASGIRDELPRRFDLPRFVELKSRWLVSIQALMYRARTLGTLSEASYRRAMARISLLGWRTGEPHSIGAAREPTVLRAAVDLLDSVRGTTLDDIAHELGLPDDMVAAIVPPAPSRPRVEAPGW